jgi:hypothetical protein
LGGFEKFVEQPKSEDTAKAVAAMTPEDHSKPSVAALNLRQTLA